MYFFFGEKVSNFSECIGLDVVGIYRLSGQTTSIQKYKTLFNTSKYEDEI